MDWNRRFTGTSFSLKSSENLRFSDDFRGKEVPVNLPFKSIFAKIKSAISVHFCKYCWAETSFAHAVAPPFCWLWTRIYLLHWKTLEQSGTNNNIYKHNPSKLFHIFKIWMRTTFWSIVNTFQKHITKKT